MLNHPFLIGKFSINTPFSCIFNSKHTGRYPLAMDTMGFRGMDRLLRSSVGHVWNHQDRPEWRRTTCCGRKWNPSKLLCFGWSSPWHFTPFILTYILSMIAQIHQHDRNTTSKHHITSHHITYFLVFYLTFSLTILSGILFDISCNILSDLFYVTSCSCKNVPQGPLTSGSRSWGRAVEVRQCPWLRSGARGWSPAVPPEIWPSRWRSGQTGK